MFRDWSKRRYIVGRVCIGRPFLTYSVFLYFPSSFKFGIVRERLRVLDSLLDGRAYDKQKSKLIDSLGSFVKEHHDQGYCTDGQDLDSVTPMDIVALLIDKDSKGKTQVHAVGCINLGKHGGFACGCPRKLAAWTVDSYIGQLRGLLQLRGPD